MFFFCKQGGSVKAETIVIQVVFGKIASHEIEQYKINVIQLGKFFEFKRV